MLPSVHWRRTVAFLRRIGIAVRIERGATGFLNHIRVVEGELYVDPRCPVSNMLHEAGHLATVPARYRSLMSGNLYQGFESMLADISRQNLHPDDPLCRAAMQASDPEATAWAWAAGIHLGLPPDLIVLDEEYDGTGADVRLSLRLGTYAGIHGLSHAGFCVTRPHMEAVLKRPVYPKLARWLQNA